MTERCDRRQRIWLALIMLFALAVRLVFAPHLAGDDDLSLAGSAIGILRHGFTVPGGNYGADYGMIVPLAGVFGVFGVGIPQLDLLPMIAAIGGIYVVARIGALMFDPVIGLIGAAAFACFPMAVQYSTLFFPDLPQGVVLGLCFLCVLHTQGGGGRATWWAVAAGAWYAYGYEVRIDSFFMGFVLLAATAFGYLPWRQLFVAAAVTGGLVGIEFAIFAKVTGHPLYHAMLEQRDANEVLAPDMNYRNMITYPKVMFLTPYEAGLHFYLLVAASVRAVLRRNRAALMLLVWVAIFLIWLMFGVDPFHHPIQLKPQLGRYLLEICVPMSVLIGWFLVGVYRHASRAAAFALGGVTLVVALVFMQFNLLNVEPALATMRATRMAVEKHWFPLYTDSQSSGIAAFLLYGSPDRTQLHAAQSHDFLTGTTRFVHIPGPTAYLLINYDFARQLHRRNLETEITPNRFGLKAQPVFAVSNPEPAASYAILRGLAALARLIPVPGISAHIEATAANVLRGDDAVIYRLHGKK